MKLKFRCQQTRSTTTVSRNEIRTFQELEDIFSQSCGCPASSVVFSLNGRDELNAPSPDASLQSLGIVSGDVIYYSRSTTDPSPSSQTLIADHSQAAPGNLQQPVSNESLNSPIPGSEMSNFRETLGSDLSMRGTETAETKLLDQEELGSTEGMDVDGKDLDVDGDKPSSLSEPYFLRKILREGFVGGRCDRNLLVAAIHAVFTESGFVRVDVVSGMRVDLLEVPEEWPSQMSLCYTVPELMGGEGVTPSIVLKFQILGHFVNVYGSLSNGGSGLYRLCLDECRFSRTLNLVWANCYENDGMGEKNGSSKSSTEREVFEFWKIVKDGLALPLLIDLCEKAGMVLPPCMMLLPSDLKLKILQLLNGVDVARMGCVCSELRYLSSNTDLWKQKYEEEFGGGSEARGTVNWKERFASSWESRKKRKGVCGSLLRAYQPVHFPYIRRDPDPLGFVPPMIGGDYDRLPGLGVPPPLGRPGLGYPRFMRRNVRPGCNLGFSP